MSGQAEEDRLRQEIAALEADRLRLSEAVIAGEAGALQEDERLEKRLVTLSRRIARRSGGGQTEALEEAGWKLRETAGGKRIWERPDTGRLYPQTAAYWLVAREEKKRRADADEAHGS